ncbi:MAG: NAD(P)H-hydrate dehydratase, partial [Bacteroidota bacterium]
MLKPRATFDHKGTYGHSLLITGSKGMMGAAQLTTQACLRSGSGLVSVQIPNIGNDILQISAPEAMTIPDKNQNHISQIPELDRYNAIGIGPGLGQEVITQQALQQLLKQAKTPLVIDADALNILSKNLTWLSLIPKDSILTPHLGEFRRLFGKSINSKAELKLLQEKANELGLIIVLKGAFTRVACPTGTMYFNSTGNPGMATGGSGDILTGILTGLLAQGYPPIEAALLGVW